MTSDPRDQNHDQELEHDLDAVRSAWSALEKAEPPGLLDQAVLNAAHRELGNGKRRRPLRWAGALATAAVIVIALGIVVQQDQQPPLPSGKQANGLKLDHDDANAKKEVPAKALEEKLRSDQFRSQAAAEPAAESAQRTKRMAAPASTVVTQAAEREEGLVSDEAIPEAGAWIEQLLTLKQNRQFEELAEELAAFRAAYPNYVLPPELD